MEVKAVMFIEELVPNVNLETAEIEFKGLIEEGPSPSGPAKEISWIKALAAFANTNGGPIAQSTGLWPRRLTVQIRSLNPWNLSSVGRAAD